jgi:hypothetical protein
MAIKKTKTKTKTKNKTYTKSKSRKHFNESRKTGLKSKKGGGKSRGISIQKRIGRPRKNTRPKNNIFAIHSNNFFTAPKVTPANYLYEKPTFINLEKRSKNAMTNLGGIFNQYKAHERLQQIQAEIKQKQQLEEEVRKQTEARKHTEANKKKTSKYIPNILR